MNSFLNISPFSLRQHEKTPLFLEKILTLTKYHYYNCNEYKTIMDSMSIKLDKIKNVEDIPYIPVRLFKLFDLISVEKKSIFKTLTSSGTTGQAVSKIYLNKVNALNQTKVLSKIVSSYLGPKRLPMIIIDSEAVIANRDMFSARGAGILGFSIFGTKKIFALDKNMELQKKILNDFVKENRHSQIFIFGFTYMIYKYFIEQVEKANLDLSNSVLIHGGGWKKLSNESITNEIYRKKLLSHYKINNVFDYYGMVEQTGSIFMECENGYLHSSIFSDIIIRDSKNFNVVPLGEKGIIQTLSILPESYPGHSILTEDEGIQIGLDNCSCGRLGKYFKVVGRIKNAEIRGCSDTFNEIF